jgi:YbbR domain-containing protein
MDIDTPPNPEISLQTVLDTVNRQGQEIEAKVDVTISEKIGQLRVEIHGTNQCMKSQLKKTKSDSQYKWRSEGNNIQFYGNNENLEDLTQALWALDNS